MQEHSILVIDGALSTTIRREHSGGPSMAAGTTAPPRGDGTYASSVTPGGDLPPFGRGREPEPSSPVAPEAAAEAALLTPGARLLADLERDSAADRKRLRWTILLAAIFHLGLLFVTLPQWDHEPKFIGQPSKVFVMEQVRFEKPPAPTTQRQEIPDPKTKRIPIPDPTPDDPEPLLQDLEVPDLPPTQTDDLFFGIPDAPDPGYAGNTGGFTGDALQVGDGILAPVGISKPQPRYTEEARQARIQGVVILSCIIDEEGNVRNLKAVKSLPLGLTESALETVATWTYKPARTHDGKPVSVYYHITVGFWLQ